jgi:hypothetical protein
MSDSKIVVSYYMGTYGPTILINVTSNANLLIMRGLFWDLSRGKIQEVSLQDVDAIAMDGLNGITLKLVSREKRKVLKRLENRDGIPSFEWARGQDAWMERGVCLIDGIIDSKRPGHQYLTQEGTDDAVIELSYKEHNIAGSPSVSRPSIR